MHQSSDSDNISTKKDAMDFEITQNTENPIIINQTVLK
jgi:hypothetical protein